MSHRTPPRRSAPDPARDRRRPCAPLGLFAARWQRRFESRGRERCCRPAPARNGSLPMKFCADDEGLRQPVRRRLHRVAEIDAPARAVAQQLLEARRVLRRGDDQDVADARQHQRGQRVVDHRLVVDRQQLLGDRQRHRIQPGAGTAGEDDAFHARAPVARSSSAPNAGSHRW